MSRRPASAFNFSSATFDSNVPVLSIPENLGRSATASASVNVSHGRSATASASVNVSHGKEAIPKVDKSVQTPSYMNAGLSAQSLAEDLSQLVGQSSYSDVTMVCDGHSVSVHKCILSTRSKVFAAMLDADMTESRTGVVKVQDVDPEVFDQFVRYLYTGILPSLTVVTARQLYEAADKYAVTSLMRRCSLFLGENLQPENACEMLILADTHSDEDFKETVTNYMLQKEIHLQDDIWFEFCKNQPTLAVELLNRSYRRTSEINHPKRRKFDATALSHL